MKKKGDPYKIKSAVDVEIQYRKEYFNPIF